MPTIFAALLMRKDLATDPKDGILTWKTRLNPSVWSTICTKKKKRSVMRSEVRRIAKTPRLVLFPGLENIVRFPLYIEQMYLEWV